MKVYLVSEWHDEGDEIHEVFATEELAQGYISIHNSGQYLEIAEHDVLTKIPEHWTLWHVSARVFADPEAPIERNDPYSRTVWNRENLPAEDVEVNISGQFVSGYPWTLDAVMRMRFTYQEVFGPPMPLPGNSPNAWFIHVKSLDKETAMRTLQEEIDRVKATING